MDLKDEKIVMSSNQFQVKKSIAGKKIKSRVFPSN